MVLAMEATQFSPIFGGFYAYAFSR